MARGLFWSFQSIHLIFQDFYWVQPTRKQERRYLLVLSAFSTPRKVVDLKTIVALVPYSFFYLIKIRQHYKSHLSLLLLVLLTLDKVVACSKILYQSKCPGNSWYCQTLKWFYFLRLHAQVVPRELERNLCWALCAIWFYAPGLSGSLNMGFS